MTLPIAKDIGGIELGSPSHGVEGLALSPLPAPFTVSSQQLSLAFILDRCLSGDNPNFSHTGPLQNALSLGVSSNLESAFHSLSENQQNQIRTQIGRMGLLETFSLAEETDSQIFFSDLLSWARHRQREHHLGAAGLAYNILSQREGSSSPLQALGEVPEELRNRAHENLEILSGGGTLGRRLEFQANRFFQGATAPAMIVGMALGTTVFTGVRSMVLPRLWAGGTTGFGARLAASSIAFVPEVGTFWITSKGIEEYLHPGSQRWDSQTNLREISSLGLTLGLLKSTGFIFGRSHQWAARLNQSGNSGHLTQALAGGSLPLWHQTGMFTGIALAHGTEIYLGWRPAQPFGAFLTDSLITLTQFNIAGRFSQVAFPRLYQLNSELNQRMILQEQLQLRGLENSLNSRRPPQNGPFSGSLNFPDFAFANAGAGRMFPNIFSNPRPSLEKLLTGPMAMAGRAGRSGGNTPPMGQPLNPANESMIRQLWTPPQAMLVEILEAAPLGILLTNKSGTIMQANRQARSLLVGTDSMILGRDLGDLVIRNPQGETSLRPEFLQEEGIPLQLREMSLDLGKLQAHYLLDQTRELELESINRRMERSLHDLAIIEDHHNIAAAIVHDLANSLLPLNVFFERDLPRLMEAWNKSRKPGEELMVEIEDISSYLNSSIERIHSFQGLGRRRRSGKTETISLRDLIYQSINLQRPRMKGREISIARNSQGIQPILMGDKVALTNTLMNLIYNAHQATPPDGDIAVRFFWNPDRVTIEVADSGEGIAPENLEQIFQPFYTTKPEGDGNGLGLFISKRIIEESHGGRLEVESEVGVGTTFRISLPTTPSEGSSESGSGNL